MSQGLLESGNAEQLTSAEDLLRNYSTALEGETNSLDAGLSALQEAVAHQVILRPAFETRHAALLLSC